MVQTETVTINGTTYTHTYSDAGRIIERQDGACFVEAIDPLNSDRTYTETDELIDPPTEADYAEAGRILLGGVE